MGARPGQNPRPSELGLSSWDSSLGFPAGRSLSSSAEPAPSARRRPTPSLETALDKDNPGCFSQSPGWKIPDSTTVKKPRLSQWVLAPGPPGQLWESTEPRPGQPPSQTPAPALDTPTKGLIGTWSPRQGPAGVWAVHLGVARGTEGVQLTPPRSRVHPPCSRTSAPSVPVPKPLPEISVLIICGLSGLLLQDHTVQEAAT